MVHLDKLSKLDTNLMLAQEILLISSFVLFIFFFLFFLFYFSSLFFSSFLCIKCSNWSIQSEVYAIFCHYPVTFCSFLVCLLLWKKKWANKYFGRFGVRGLGNWSEISYIFSLEYYAKQKTSKLWEVMGKIEPDLHTMYMWHGMAHCNIIYSNYTMN